MSFILFILNDAPCGSERTCNARRRAGALAAREGQVVHLSEAEKVLAF